MKDEARNEVAGRWLRPQRAWAIAATGRTEIRRYDVTAAKDVAAFRLQAPTAPQPSSVQERRRLFNLVIAIGLTVTSFLIAFQFFQIEPRATTGRRLFHG
jgi:hypothetical protein